MKQKRNSVVVAVVSLLLCLAIYLNWSYNAADIGEEDSLSAAALQDDTLVDANSPEAADTAISDAERFTAYQWNLSGSSAADAETMNRYFDETRLSRQQSKDEAVSLLQETMANESASAEARASAEASLNAIAAYAMAESRIESLVMAKGFPECVAIVDEGSVNVIVQPAEQALVSSDVAKITDIVLNETSASADQIRVVQAG